MGSVTYSTIIVYYIINFNAKMVYLFIKRDLLKNIEVIIFCDD